MGGTIDRATVRETQHGNHATQMCSLAHWATTYIQQMVHVTQRHSYLHQSRQRLSHSKCDATSQLSSPVSSQKLSHSKCDATSQLSSPVSSQRLSHNKCDATSQLGYSKSDAPSQLFTPDSQPRHGSSNSSGGSAIVTHRHS